MAFKIKFTGSVDVPSVTKALKTSLEHSRFLVGDFQLVDGIKRTTAIELRTIRLRVKKGYCGNHPGPCLLNRPHKKADFLEGLDWVEFNDLLNDVLDAHSVSANVASSHVIIRKNFERCTYYADKLLTPTHRDWIKDSGKFENYCGKAAPRANCMDGTPGGINEQH